MAGIGFRLKRLLDQESYISTIKAYLYSALISSGPWLITTLVIGLLGLLQMKELSYENARLFRATIIYVYAFSLIVIGFVQMPLTRYLADLLYASDTEMYYPTYCGSLLLVGAVQTLIGAPVCFLFSGWNPVYALSAFTLYLCVSFIWLIMIFLSTAKDYTSISLAFVLGGAVCVIAGIFFGRRWGVTGYLAGFTAGQVLIFIILSLRMVVEFRSKLPLSFDFLRYMKIYPTLLLTGLLYNAAIWIDKFVFWFSPAGEHTGSFFYTCPLYDLPVFLAYLTVVPSMALFLIQVETAFYVDYKNYYGAIINKSGLNHIYHAKNNMIDTMRFSISKTVKQQLLVSLVAILLVPYLVEPMHLSWLQVSVLRISILAAFIQILFLFLIICLLYFEFRIEALSLICFLFITNGAGAWLSIKLGVPFYGYGYFTAYFFSLLLGVFVLDYKIRNLEYITFVQQPVK